MYMEDLYGRISKINKIVFMTENNLLDSFYEIVLYQFDELYKYYNQLAECRNSENYEEYFFLLI